MPLNLSGAAVFTGWEWAGESLVTTALGHARGVSGTVVTSARIETQCRSVKTCAGRNERRTGLLELGADRQVKGWRGDGQRGK